MGSSSAAACPLSIKFAWHMAKLTHLRTVHGCLPNATAELREVRQMLQGSTAWDSALSGPLQKTCASPCPWGTVWEHYSIPGVDISNRGCSSVARHVLSMHEFPGLILTTTTITTTSNL